jgi:transmembrane sensor
MTNVYKLPSTEQRFDEASLWIAKLDGDLSTEDRQALVEWMRADPENQTMFLKMVELWDKMEDLSRLSDLFPRPDQSHAPLSRKFIAIAASVLIGVLVVVLNGIGRQQVNDPNVSLELAQSNYEQIFETGIGERSKFTLPDNSQLILNTDSLIEVSFSERHRRLVLQRGEVHVKVAHDTSRPLSVFAADSIVQAVGTAFNLQIIGDNEIELVVTEGKVLVDVQDSSRLQTSTSIPPVLSDSAILVSEGQEMRVGEPDEEVKLVTPSEIEVRLSWRQGNLVFQGETLEEAIKEIGRYTTVEFFFLSNDIKNLRVAGRFKAGDVDGLLLTLSENFNISNQQIGERKILLSFRNS